MAHTRFRAERFYNAGESGSFQSHRSESTTANEIKELQSFDIIIFKRPDVAKDLPRVSQDTVAGKMQ
jgi:hypothetical protein